MPECPPTVSYTHPLPESTAISLNGFVVWDEGVQEHWAVFGQSNAKRVLTCYWADRLNLLYSLVGSAGINAQNQYVIDYQSPYPYAPALLYLNSIDMMGIAVQGLSNEDTGQANIVAYQYAKITLNYQTPPYNYGNLEVTSLDFSVEELAAPNQDGTPAFFYATGPAPAGVALLGRQVVGEAIPSVRVTIMNFSITQYYVPIVPLSGVQSCIGMVNSTSLTMSQLGGSPSLLDQLQQLLAQGLQPQNGYQPVTFAGQTLLFNGAKSNRRVALANDGASMQDVSYSFSFNIQGWNNKIQPGANPLWQPVCDQNNMPPLTIDPNNFSSLGIFSS